MSEAAEIARSLTRAQKQALECFLPGRQYGPSMPSRGVARHKSSLGKAGLLSSDLSYDNYGAPLAFWYLTTKGIAVRSQVLAKARGEA